MWLDEAQAAQQPVAPFHPDEQHSRTPFSVARPPSASSDAHGMHLPGEVLALICNALGDGSDLTHTLKGQRREAHHMASGRNRPLSYFNGVSAAGAPRALREPDQGDATTSLASQLARLAHQPHHACFVTRLTRDIELPYSLNNTSRVGLNLADWCVSYPLCSGPR